MTHPDDDVARNIEAQQAADGMPTDAELQEAREKDEQMKETVTSLVTEGIEAGLIDHVFVEAQRGHAMTKPNKLGTVADKLGRSDEYEKHVKNVDPLFQSTLVRKAADDQGIPVEEESRPDPRDS